MRKKQAPERAEVTSPTETRLGGELDRLNQAIQEFEESLNSLKLGVSVAVKFPDPDRRTLRYGKTCGVWGLFVDSPADLNQPAGRYSYVRLISSTKETRLQATELFEALGRELHAEYNRQLEAVEKAVKKCKQFTAWVRSSKGS